ncbi:MAG TPA: MFS transporter [Jatrophihabitantaceae bacterium]|jgi:predicted MFS family arabinose efflux permease|nr:MFS transporter [Jatrophihabitantaceae bacterium]
MNPRRRRLVFTYLTVVYFLAGASETYISPLFPLMRHDLHLQVSDQATLIAALTISIAVGNIAGGWIGNRFADRHAVRGAAALLAAGSLLSGMSNSFVTIAVGQVLSGLGTGLFFAPGLAVVGRMYPTSLGRAIASYGLGYSCGLAAAAFASGLGVDLWRWVFLATGALALVFTICTPKLPEAEGSPSTGLVRAAVGYWRDRGYRAAMTVGVVAGICNYIVIGLTPEHFVGQHTSAKLIGALVGIGRIASMVGKYVSGWLLDKIGGPATAQLLMSLLVAFGLAELATPYPVGLWAVVPVVCTSAMLFPVSNAMVVAALPGRATWGVGVYRAALMVSSAICSGLSGLALHMFSTTAVMIAALGIPLLAVLVYARTAHRPTGAVPAVRTDASEVVM